MTVNDFTYWLQGFAELHGEPPTPQQWEMIKEYLSLVFEKVTTTAARPEERRYCAPVGGGNLPDETGGRLCRDSFITC